MKLELKVFGMSAKQAKSPNRQGLWLFLVGVLPVAAAFAFAAPHAAPAQTAADCIEPQSQSLINACAAKEFEAADAALNAAWKQAKSFGDAIGKGKELLKAQRAWLAYRDAACLVHASPFEGGTIQPLIHSTCLSELTAERTRMLLEFHAY